MQFQFEYRQATVTHRNRPDTIENVCIDCGSYMEHIDVYAEHFHCPHCNHTSERIYHIGISSGNEIISNRTNQARADLNAHATSDCPHVKKVLAEMAANRKK